MASGTPVVASGSSSLPEVVGDAGVLVDPADVEGWTDALERVCGDADLQATLHRRGLLRASEFTWSRAAQRTWQGPTPVAPPPPQPPPPGSRPPPAGDR